MPTNKYWKSLWWIDKPHLLGSSNPTSADLARLRSDAFGILVSLLCDEEQAPRYAIAHATALGYVRYNIAVKGFSPPTVEQLEQFVKLVDGSPPGTKTIVHCEGGTGRTGTFAAAYWVTKGMTVAEAITYVRKARHCAVETPEQEGILTEFSSRIQARSLDAQQEVRGCTLWIMFVNTDHQEWAVEPELWVYLVALPVNRNRAWEAL